MKDKKVTAIILVAGNSTRYGQNRNKNLENISGKTMDRPAFIEMMNDVENGLIDTIIVKDLSRFGRNHI